MLAFNTQQQPRRRPYTAAIVLYSLSTRTTYIPTRSEQSVAMPMRQWASGCRSLVEGPSWRSPSNAPDWSRASTPRVMLAFNTQQQPSIALYSLGTRTTYIPTRSEQSVAKHANEAVAVGRSWRSPTRLIGPVPPLLALCLHSTHNSNQVSPCALLSRYTTRTTCIPTRSEQEALPYRRENESERWEE